MDEQNNLNPDKILKEVLELPYGASVADLGCGSMAFFTIAAAKLVGDKGIVYACDVIKDILSAVLGKAKQAGLFNIKTIWTNLEIVGATKISQPLDYVFLTTTLFQSKKHKEMLTEARRLLKEGGRLLLIEWVASSGPMGPAPEMRVKKEEIENLALTVGFKKIKEFPASASHYGLIFEK